MENLVDKSSEAFIDYVEKRTFLITKAMLKSQEPQGIKIFWFSANTSSNKVKSFRENPKASIYFMDRRFFCEVTICGQTMPCRMGASGETKEQTAAMVLPIHGVIHIEISIPASECRLSVNSLH